MISCCESIDGEHTLIHILANYYLFSLMTLTIFKEV